MNDKTQKHLEMIDKANRFVAEAAPRAAEDPHRLAYHFMAPACWMNDPNGFSYYNGEYHLFYQHYPFNAAPTFSFKYWGHAKSKDLVRWEHLPIALAPSEDYEMGGCWSGSAVDDNGKLTLIYTGHVDDRSPKEVQAIAVSEDGVVFRKYEGNPVIAHPPEDASEDFRDPKVWRHGGHWYMIVGTGKDGIGKVVWYRSDDLRSWTYLGVLAQSDGTQGHMWECPDLFRLGDKDVLIVSPIGMKGHKNIAIVGTLDYEAGKFTGELFQELDCGPDFYAATTLQDAQNRRIMIAWMDMWENPMPTVANDWAGAMTIPRELYFNEQGKLATRPVKEMETIRASKLREGALQVSSENPDKLGGVQSSRLEIAAEADLAQCRADEFGFKLRRSSDGNEEIRVGYRPSTQTLVIDTRQCADGLKAEHEVKLEPGSDGKIKLQLYLDNSSLEVFGNDGEIAFSCRVYPSPSSLGAAAYSQGGSIEWDNLDIWELSLN
jgi:beta-fructofuranosidase